MDNGTGGVVGVGVGVGVRWSDGSGQLLCVGSFVLGVRTVWRKDKADKKST